MPAPQIAETAVALTQERLRVGNMQQELAKTEQQLELEKETAAEMKARVAKLNQTFITSGEGPPAVLAVSLMIW